MAKGITEAAVHAAADALVSAGERPTVERIRTHLGTGSPNTVTRWLESWWQQLGPRLQARRYKLALPDVPPPVVALASEWWEQALAAARTEAERALAEEGTRLERERRELGAREATWEAQLHQFAGAAEAAQQALSASEQRLADLQRLCDGQAEQVRDLAAQRDAAQLRGERLEREVMALATRLQAQEQRAAGEREEQAQHLRALEDRANAEIDRARQETKAVRAELTARVHRLEAEGKAGREREELGRLSLVQTQQEAAVQRARADTLERQLQRTVTTSKATRSRPAHGARPAPARKRRPTP